LDLRRQAQAHNSSRIPAALDTHVLRPPAGSSVTKPDASKTQPSQSFTLADKN